NSPLTVAVTLTVAAALAPPPPPVTPPSTLPTGSTPGGSQVPTLFDRMPVTTTTGEGWQADLDYRLMQIAAELTQLAQGSPGVAVDHLTVAPTSLTLTINTVPTTVAVDHVTVAPTSVTLTPPTQVTLG